MSKISPFQNNTERYDRWFDKNHWVYEAELCAVKALLPEKGRGVEIGVGTGRFAQPLGIKWGIEPSSYMRVIAQRRGIHILSGIAEQLPFNNSVFDFSLMVTTVCFVDNIIKTFQEAYRILTDGGSLIIGLVDRKSPVGQIYLKHQSESVFYKEATFFSVDEIIEYMDYAGFKDFHYRQTIFTGLAETTENEPVKSGYGKGSFVAIRGLKAKKTGRASRKGR